MNRKGFTPIELLVVIAIVGILATMVIVALGGARARTRDATRKNDLAQLKSALELYYADQKPARYVASNGKETISGTTDSLSVALMNGFMKEIPVDPKNKGSYIYTYESFNNGADYELTATLESKKDSDGNGGVPGGYKLTNQ